MSAITDRIESGSLPEPNSGCWHWLGTLDKWGYGTLSIENATRLAHRISCEAVRGPTPEGMWVLHHCDVPSCVNPEHLYFGTPSQNAIDRVRRSRGGGQKAGEGNSMSRITQDTAQAIFDDSRSHSQTAAAFGVSKGLVGDIKIGRKWKMLRR